MKSVRAFTLIELMVSITVAIAITSAAMGVLLTTISAQNEVRKKAQLARDAQLVIDRFAYDTAYLGAGIPRGVRTDAADFSGLTQSAHQLRPPIRVGLADNFVFVGDLPLENADLSGIMKAVDTDQNWSGNGADTSSMMFSSELCPCVPKGGLSSSYTCSCTSTALISGSFASTDDCSATQLDARLCPWAMNKWQTTSDGNAYFVLGDASGDWVYRRWDMATTGIGTDEWGLRVKFAGWRPSGNTGEVTGAGSAAIDITKFHKPIGSGFASTPDRVFWSFEGKSGGACAAGSKDCVIKRRHCWGRVVDPATTGFPKVMDAAVRSDVEPDDCTAGTDGTPWETIATRVSAFSIRYFGNAATQFSAPWTAEKSSQTRLVEIAITLEDVADNRTLKVSQARRVFLPNAGGILGKPLAEGGCVGDGC